MPLRIVRNDITKMNTEAIVNTANDHVTVGSGCDFAIYTAAGYDELLDFRAKNIGFVEEGGVFITPGFNLQAKYIIHAVSPHYVDGKYGEEERLRSCYNKSLLLAKEYDIKSIAFPLISTGGFGYPKEEGMRIAVDEINAFLLENDMDVVLVVFGSHATELGEKIFSDLEQYIGQSYVEEREEEEYDTFYRRVRVVSGTTSMPRRKSRRERLDDLMKLAPSTFSEYLLELIEQKGMENAEVWKRAIVDKKVFSKMKTTPNYHPQKITALCLCVGAKLSITETKELLARAGYALSPCDKTDIIFSFFMRIWKEDGLILSQAERMFLHQLCWRKNPVLAHNK